MTKFLKATLYILKKEDDQKWVYTHYFTNGRWHPYTARNNSVSDLNWEKLEADPDVDVQYLTEAEYFLFVL